MPEERETQEQGTPQRDGAEVERRVRRQVGFKVMRDLHRDARSMEEERRQRPRLVTTLLAIIVAGAVIGLLAVLYVFR